MDEVNEQDMRLAQEAALEILKSRLASDAVTMKTVRSWACMSMAGGEKTEALMRVLAQGQSEPRMHKSGHAHEVREMFDPL